MPGGSPPSGKIKKGGFAGDPLVPRLQNPHTADCPAKPISDFSVQIAPTPAIEISSGKIDHRFSFFKRIAIENAAVVVRCAGGCVQKCLTSHIRIAIFL